MPGFTRRATHVLGLLAIINAVGINPARTESPPSTAVAARTNQILWDTWGVPHIYGDDEDHVAYGFGWAQMHNHAEILLRLYGESRGRAAEYWGEEQLGLDQLMRAADIPQRGHADLASAPPHLQRYVAAFADGVNAYAREHPNQIADEVRAVLPVEPADVVAHVHRVQFTFVALMGGEARILRESSVSRPGSNAWAIGPSRSTSGHALLLVNPHLDWNDPMHTFFESHLNGPGLNIYGATLVGMPVIVMGFNERLGWAHTVNTIDALDSYRLAVVDGGYLFDGAVLPFDVERQTIKVRQTDGSLLDRSLSVRRTVHGPVVLDEDDLVLAARWAPINSAATIQQWRDMAVAQNLAGFEAVVHRLDIPMFTIIYADQQGQIMSLFGGRVPVRPEGDAMMWQQPVDGTTSALLWSGTHPYEDLPRVVDPITGWVQNSNSPPWNTTYPSPLEPMEFPPYMAPQEMSFREQRGVRMLRESDLISLDGLQERLYSNHMELADRILDDLIQAGIEYGGPRAIEASAVLTEWDRGADVDSRGAVLFTLWAMEISRDAPALSAVFEKDWDASSPLLTPSGLVDPQTAARTLEDVADQVLQAYGALNVPWGAVMRFQRAGMDLPAHGAFGDPLGVFHVVAFTPTADGRFASTFGGTFIAAVEFGPVVQARVLMTYGNATRPGSAHNGDQLVVLADKALRPAWLTRADIEANLGEVTALVETRRPMVIVPPLQGTGWFNANGCCAASPHRTGRIVVDGARYVKPELFGNAAFRPR